MEDMRVQAIRCCSCRRLRPLPSEHMPWCLCGGAKFESSFPLPDEEEWAIQIYEKDLKERELWKYT